MPSAAIGSPAEGESSTVNPVLPSKGALDCADRPYTGLKRLEWERAAAHGDAGAQVDLEVQDMQATQRGAKRPGTVPPRGWMHFVAGGVGGMCGAIVTSPLDVVKTRLQSDLFQTKAATVAAGSPKPSLLASTRRLAYHFVETGHILRNIAVKESPRALFKGLGPTLVGVIPARSINFYTYGNGKLILADYLNGGKESAVVHLLAAASAGMVTATATNPIWVVKTRLQLESHSLDRAVEASRQAAVRKQPSPSRPTAASFTTWSRQAMASQASTTDTGTRDAFSSSRFFKPSPSPPRPSTNSVQMTLRIIQAEGVAGLYKGMSASYLGVAEGTIQWTLYEQFKRSARQPADALGTPPSKARQWAGTVGAAGTAKMIASLITYPHEVSVHYGAPSHRLVGLLTITAGRPDPSTAGARAWGEEKVHGTRANDSGHSARRRSGRSVRRSQRSSAPRRAGE